MNVQTFARICRMNAESIYRTIVMSIARIKKIEKNKVIFVSFNGKNYADNPKAISNALHELFPQANIVWAYKSKKNPNIPQYIKQVKFDSIQYNWELATAKVWVNNGNLLKGTRKRKNQYYIQTWHGDRVPKKVLYDAIELESYKKRHINLKVPEEKLCDLCIAGSDLGERVYRSAFRYKGKILKTGSPRNDILINVEPDRVTKVYRDLNLDTKIHYILFAPTFRDGRKKNQNVDVDLSAILNILEEKGEKWNCLLRAHVGSSGLEYVEEDRRLIDVTKYDDIADLMLVSDILLTDYSSCCGDFILLGRPVVLCHFDIEEYKTSCRQFNIDFEKSNYLIAKNQEELNELVRELPNMDIVENCHRVLEYFGTVETGHASQDVAKLIIKYIQ